MDTFFFMFFLIALVSFVLGPLPYYSGAVSRVRTRRQRPK